MFLYWILSNFYILSAEHMRTVPTETLIVHPNLHVITPAEKGRYLAYQITALDSTINGLQDFDLWKYNSKMVFIILH